MFLVFFENQLNYEPCLWLLNFWPLTNLAVEATPSIWTRAASTSQVSSIVFARNELAGLRVLASISFRVLRTDAMRLQLLVQPAMSSGLAGVSATSGAITVSNVARF